MSEKFPAGSQAEKDQQSAKKFSIIAIIAYIGLHVVCFALSKARFKNVGEHPLYWGIVVIGLAAVALTIIEVRKDAEVTEISKVPYIASLFLMWASCWALFYCAAC